jgi:hypothetical protein
MFPTASRAHAQQVELNGLIRHRVVVSDIDIAMMRKVERFILRYVGDDPVCTENLGPDVLVMKSTKNRV